MKRFTYLLLVLLLVVNCVFAAPSTGRTAVHKQSDGTELYIKLVGDESFHYYSTIDGVPIVKGGNGDYYYATLSADGCLLATELIAHNKGARSLEENSLIDANDFSGMRSEMRNLARSRAASYAASKSASIAPLGDVYVPVLLVEYSDVKFKFSKEVVSDFLNKENYEGYANPIAKSIGSAKDYFIAQSGGKFRPHFIVTDIVTLPNTMAYYGGNDSSGNDKRPGHMIADGLAAANANFDFSIFDNDGDGNVEFVYCIYAGYGENVTGNSANTIWPHQWELSATTGTKTYDGVKFDVYACSNELSIGEDFAEAYGADYLSGIGTMCHEFSHCLGLPDLYDTSGSGESTMEYWDLMDSGSYAAEGYVPVGYSAYERDFMGWKELEVLTEKGRYSMSAITTAEGKGYKIINDANSDEYFILENRQNEGWDTYLFNAGMLISHIDYNKSIWDNNTLNTNKNRLRYQLVPADNEILHLGEDESSAVAASYRGDVWPGTSGNTAFTDTSVPAATVYTGGYLGKPVTDIKLENRIISFSFMMGVVDTPVSLEATAVSATSFQANWEAVEYAEEYIVELEKVVEATEGEGDAKSLLEENFVGCTKANQLLSNLDDYLSVPGWTGSKLYGESGVLRVGTAASAGYIRTPKLNHSGTVTLTFSMANYSSSDTGSKLTVSVVSTSGVATDIETYSATTAWADKEIEIDVTGDFYIELSTKNSTTKKRVSIDNVVVSYKSSVVSTFVERVSTDTTSYIFTGLEPGTQYRYRVSASDGYASSDFSDYINVTTESALLGDINADGTVDVADVTGVVGYILSADSSVDTAAYDVNGDGAIDVADITKIVSIILGVTE